MSEEEQAKEIDFKRMKVKYQKKQLQATLQTHSRIKVFLHAATVYLQMLQQPFYKIMFFASRYRVARLVWDKFIRQPQTLTSSNSSSKCSRLSSKSNYKFSNNNKTSFNLSLAAPKVGLVTVKTLIIKFWIAIKDLLQMHILTNRTSQQVIP